MASDKQRVLRRAKSLLRKRGWNKRVFARDIAGLPVNSLSPQAASFCVLGAIIRATYELQLPRLGKAELDARDALREAVGVTSLGVWNDYGARSVENVLDALNRAERIRVHGK